MNVYQHMDALDHDGEAAEKDWTVFIFIFSEEVRDGGTFLKSFCYKHMPDVLQNTLAKPGYGTWHNNVNTY